MKKIIAKIGAILTIISMAFLPILLTSNISLPIDSFQVMMYYIFYIPVIGAWSFDFLLPNSEGST